VNKKKKIAIALSAMLTVFISLVLFASTAMAAVSIGSRNVTSMFDYNGGSGWKDLSTPEHYVVGTSPEQVAYCLQHKNDSPHNSAYNDSDILSSYSSRVQTGLCIVLENGYPYSTGSLTATEARYATANAVRFWLSENGISGQYNFTNLGAYSDSQLRSYAAAGQIGNKIRANSGYTDVLQFSVELLIQARSQSLMTHSISLSTPSMSISGSYFVGTSRVTLSNMNGGYTLDTSALPAGTSISGYRLWRISRWNEPVCFSLLDRHAANNQRGTTNWAARYHSRNDECRPRWKAQQKVKRNKKRSLLLKVIMI